jgi:hypothetical protein
MAIDLLPPAGNVGGKNLKYFIKKFWQEVCPIPKAENPIWDNNGTKDESFNNKIKEDLFMLSPSMSPQEPITRNIKIPENKGLLIPIVPVEVSECETKLPLVATANKDQASIITSSLSLDLDGTVYHHNDLKDYEFRPQDIDEFTVNFPVKDESIFPIIKAQDSCNAVAAGRYVWTAPLEPGKNYTVHYKGELNCGGSDCLEKKYSEDITYNITVSS